MINKKHPSHCLYDWRQGQRWKILECVTGESSHSKSSSVFRFLSLGYDVLDELKLKDMLTGQALEDAGMEW
jgi:hypothetical protein